MDTWTTFIQTFKELGIAGVSIGTIGYIALQMIKENREARQNYTSFVQENNHTTTDLVREATATMVEVKNTISNHNELTKMLLEEIRNKKL